VVQFEVLIISIITAPSISKNLRNNKIAHWDNRLNAIVIIDYNNPDCGTAFKPARGRAYFDSLR